MATINFELFYFIQKNTYKNKSIFYCFHLILKSEIFLELSHIIQNNSDTVITEI
jgi:hypothetical protein